MVSLGLNRLNLFQINIFMFNNSVSLWLDCINGDHDISSHIGKDTD